MYVLMFNKNLYQSAATKTKNVTAADVPGSSIKKKFPKFVLQYKTDIAEPMQS